MQFRGLILIIFGGSMMLSPLAIRMANEAGSEPSGPRQIQTEGALDAACDAASVTTPMGRMGCNRNASQVTTRRIAAGGATFVTVRTAP